MSQETEDNTLTLGAEPAPDEVEDISVFDLDPEPDHEDVFDPSEGRLHSLDRESLREMWGDAGAGHYLLALSKGMFKPDHCDSCGLDILSEVRCPEVHCGKAVPLQLGGLLGCINRECPEATWETVMCPHCGVLIEDLKAWSAW